MTLPYRPLILEAMCMCEGIHLAAKVSEMLASLLSDAPEKLSKQPQYDWGLRKMRSIVRATGYVKRSNPSKSEIDCLYTAIHHCVMPALTKDDNSTFTQMLNGLFLE